MSNKNREELIEEVSREIAEFQSASDRVDEASVRLGIDRTEPALPGAVIHARLVERGATGSAAALSATGLRTGWRAQLCPPGAGL